MPHLLFIFYLNYYFDNHILPSVCSLVSFCPEINFPIDAPVYPLELKKPKKVTGKGNGGKSGGGGEGGGRGGLLAAISGGVKLKSAKDRKQKPPPKAPKASGGGGMGGMMAEMKRKADLRKKHAAEKEAAGGK